MKIIATILIAVIALSANSQDQTVKALQAESGKSVKKDPADTSKKNWKRGGIYSLNVSQASLTNWAAGGDEFSLAVNSLLSMYAFYQKDKHSWDNTFDFNLGYVKSTSIGGRKNDDRFDLLSKYGYALTSKLNLAGLVNLRSQFFKGYTFDNNVKSLSSNFLAPGYLLVSAGLDYKPIKELSIFISPLTARWVIVRDTALSNKGAYGVTPGQKSNLEIGAFASINYMKEISKNITYKARLDLFSNYRRNPQNVDLFMSNILNVKLSKVLSATWGVDLIYDDDVKLFGPNRTSPALQVKSLVGIGLLVKF
ncbi:hypothetical protein CAP36_09775 [Chitinophagaceae bacterium IBVUCB2]|nr:hypothetical protein CAP36_09775 [Chitinophagaceae bacterium IBVUCB2]